MIKKLTWMFHAMFITHYGEFNWLSITSIVAICTLIGSMIYNRRKIKADLVSKARLEWMDKVRTLYAMFIEYFAHYKYLYDECFVENEASKQDLDFLMDKIRKTYYELKLYIPANTSNELLLKDIELIWCELSYISDYYNYGRKHNLIKSVKFNNERTNYDEVVDEYLSELVTKSANDGSQYFKKEWEKVKNGE